MDKGLFLLANEWVGVSEIVKMYEILKLVMRVWDSKQMSETNA